MQLDLASLPKNDLVRMAAEAGLPTYGTKQNLIDRLTGGVEDVAPAPVDAVVLACGCLPGETCGRHVPVPSDWPPDLPLPDVELPTLAPPIYRTIAPDVPPLQDGEIRCVNRQCYVAFRVCGRGRVERGTLLDGTLIETRDLAMATAMGKGINARAPRLAVWVADPDGAGGVATIAMTIKGG